MSWTQGAPRVRAYLRVSSDGQTVENQRADIEEYARARRYEIAHVYEETASAATARPVFKAMQTDARRGRFDVLLVWSIDRLGRSLAGNVSAVTDLDEVGVSVASVREDWLEVRGPVRPLLIAILSWVAEQERATLIARTNAGLARARAQGKRLGRPTRHVDIPRVLELRAAGDTIRRISIRLKISRSTIERALKKATPRKEKNHDQEKETSRGTKGSPRKDPRNSRETSLTKDQRRRDPPGGAASNCGGRSDRDRRVRIADRGGGSAAAACPKNGG